MSEQIPGQDDRDEAREPEASGDDDQEGRSDAEEGERRQAEQEQTGQESPS